MALDNLTSRQTGLEKSIANDLEKLSARMNVLADIQNEHSNHLMVLGPDFPKDRHAPQHPEPPPGVEPQHGSVEQNTGTQASPLMLTTLQAEIENQSQ